MASMRSHVDVIHHSSFPSLLEKPHVFRSLFFLFLLLSYASLLFLSSSTFWSLYSHCGLDCPNTTVIMPTTQGQNQFSLPGLIKYPFLEAFSFLYIALQFVINWIFAPVPPPPASAAGSLPTKRVAVIGAGLTGVSSAAHCVGHGFDVQIFEARSKDKGLGGIWSVRGVLIHPGLFREYKC